MKNPIALKSILALALGVFLTQSLALAGPRAVNEWGEVRHLVLNPDGPLPNKPTTLVEGAKAKIHRHVSKGVSAKIDTVLTPGNIYTVWFMEVGVGMQQLDGLIVGDSGKATFTGRLTVDDAIDGAFHAIIANHGPAADLTPERLAFELSSGRGPADRVQVAIFERAASAGQDELAEVRAATAQYQRVEVAIAAGYELGYVNGDGARIITGCIANPEFGAMGYHFFNKELIDDLVVDPLQPEGLVYEALPNGKLKLVAVEWIVPGEFANPSGVSEPPSVLGMKMHILVPAVGWYIQHAWIWKHNPSGMFTDWNPNVICP
ncbi:MAG: hypothetical protein ACI9R3_002059 [Verrucomicrobiales bacterium]|jgi:hypothetical protein